MRYFVLICALLLFSFFRNAEAVKLYDYSAENIGEDCIVNAITPPRPMSVSQLVDDILARKDNSEVTELKISQNYISDEGAKAFNLRLWAKDMLPSLISLDISLNRVTTQGLKEFEPLLQRPNFKYLNICGNPAASIESQDYFSKMDSNILSKIIWVPEKWVEAQKWTVVINARNDISLLTNNLSTIFREYYTSLQTPRFPEIKIVPANELVEKDIKITAERTPSLEELIKKAREGEVDAIMEIAKLYETGAFFRKDITKAVGWVHAAADKNDPDAAYILAQKYKTLPIIPIIPEQNAEYWLEKSKKLKSLCALLGYLVCDLAMEFSTVLKQEKKEDNPHMEDE